MRCERFHKINPTLFIIIRYFCFLINLNKTVLQNIFTKIVLFIILLILIPSCNVTKHVSKDKHLLDKNTIVVNGKKNSSTELYSYLSQKPNQKILGFPFSLHLYNLGNPDTLSIKWPQNKPKFNRWLTKKISQKQVNALSRTAKGLNKWFLKNGNPPVISDSIKIKRSSQNLENYYFNNGFWDATVDYRETKKDSSKVIVDYIVTTKDPYFLDTVFTDIKSPILDSLFKKNRKKSTRKKKKNV